MGCDDVRQNDAPLRVCRQSWAVRMWTLALAFGKSEFFQPAKTGDASFLFEDDSAAAATVAPASEFTCAIIASLSQSKTRPAWSVGSHYPRFSGKSVWDRFFAHNATALSATRCKEIRSVTEHFVCGPPLITVAAAQTNGPIRNPGASAL